MIGRIEQPEKHPSGAKLARLIYRYLRLLQRDVELWLPRYMRGETWLYLNLEKYRESMERTLFAAYMLDYVKCYLDMTNAIAAYRPAARRKMLTTLYRKAATPNDAWQDAFRAPVDDNDDYAKRRREEQQRRDDEEALLLLLSLLLAGAWYDRLGHGVIAAVREMVRRLVDLILRTITQTVANVARTVGAAAAAAGTTVGDAVTQTTTALRRLWTRQYAAEIAEEEAYRALQAARLAAAKESGVRWLKEWSVLDEKACKWCMPLHKNVIELNQPFAVDPKFGTIMTSPYHFRCRCSVAMVDSDLVANGRIAV